MSDKVVIDRAFFDFEYVTQVFGIECPECGKVQSYRHTPIAKNLNGEYCANEECGAFLVLDEGDSGDGQ